jgi:hypothetical protein
MALDVGAEADAFAPIDDDVETCGALGPVCSFHSIPLPFFLWRFSRCVHVLF